MWFRSFLAILALRPEVLQVVARVSLPFYSATWHHVYVKPEIEGRMGEWGVRVGGTERWVTGGERRWCINLFANEARLAGRAAVWWDYRSDEGMLEIWNIKCKKKNCNSNSSEEATSTEPSNSAVKKYNFTNVPHQEAETESKKRNKWIKNARCGHDAVNCSRLCFN